MSWFPNVDAVEFFVHDIFPTVRESFPEAEFWIVGADPSEKVLALKEFSGVHVTGTVADIREPVWKAAVYVSPLRYGLGCKNKILEAMALGVPIVATPKSLTGTPIKDGRDLLVAEDASQFAETVKKLLSDEALRRSLAEEARRLVEKNYSWDGIAKQFENFYEDFTVKAAN